MISKILLTLSVIVLAWLVVRNRQRRMALMTAQPPAAKPAAQASGSWRVGVYLFVAAMILVSGVLIYQRWQDGDQVVTVRVVDTQSGRSVTYRARRSEVEERHFVTLDGREVSVAETERIEVERSDDRR